MEHRDSKTSPTPKSSSCSTNSTSAVASALVISASYKAGMDNIDRQRIDAIILRESQNSLYMQQQVRRDHKVNERIAQMKQRLDQHEQNNGAKDNWKQQLEAELEPEIHDILKTRRHRSTCCVIDMDMFFMACELLSRPHLKNVPCCVGHNMISTSNYEARKYGVRSAMAGWIGDKLVHELSGGTKKLVHVSSNFDLYRQKSNIVCTVLREYDPHYRCMSLDEAYVELGPYLALKLSKRWCHEQISQYLLNNYSNQSTLHADNQQNNGDEQEPKDTDSGHAPYIDDFELILQSFTSTECLVAANDTLLQLRQKVCEATGGLTCSAGLAPNFMLAKIASDINKPNGQKLVGPRLEEDVHPFLRPLPTRKIPGIGRVTQKILEAFGIASVQHLHDERALVRFLFQPASSKHLLRASEGGYGSSSSSIQDENLEEGGSSNANRSSNLKQKGISRERTFTPGQSWPDLNSRLEDIARQLSKDMKEKGVWARTISLKIKLHTFDVLQKSRTVEACKLLQDGDDLLLHASEMLRDMRKEYNKNHESSKGKPPAKFSLRLIGIRCSNLMDESERLATASEQRGMEKFLVSPTRTKTAPTILSGPFATVTPSTIAQPVQVKRKPIESFFHQNKENRNASNNEHHKKPPPDERSSNGTCSKAQSFQENAKSPVAVSTVQSTSSNSDVQSTPEAVDGLKATPKPTSTCPICNHKFVAETMDALNRVLNNHIDACLNGPVVRQAVQEETLRASKNQTLATASHKTTNGANADSACSTSSVQPKRKKQRLTEFFVRKS